MPDLNDPGNLNPHRASFPSGSYDGWDEDPEAQRPASTYDPFHPSTQDIPLLHRLPTREELHEKYKAQAPVLQYMGPGQYSEQGTSGPAHQGRSYVSLPLFHGNLVLNCPIPPKLAKSLPDTNPPDEFSHTRYTAATCDPVDFTNDRFTLRQQLFATPRQTELMIVVTMYNEDDVLFANTMGGVFQNIDYMCQGKGPYGGSFGVDGWKRIVVLVVSDGRKQLNPRTAAVLTALGVYQSDILNGKEAINGKPVTAHIFEYTTRVGIKVNNGIVETHPSDSRTTPVQMIFCLKEKNQQKINSHRWALQAFGEALFTNSFPKISSVVVLLDAGTEPGPDSIYQLYRAFELDKHCGGACGEIKADLGKMGINLWKNPLVATQNFEYKMSNILDKPMESAFGFISVLPGAFSAYRFKALQNDSRGEGPLQKYFFGEKAHASANIFTKNMYLAEDRILCFELVSKRDESWVLTYVQSATGKTDVPDQMSGLVKQRRRWLNGSFFAAVYALTHFYQIFRSRHTMGRKIMFLVEFLFQFVNMIFAWFALGNFFLVFQILTTSLGQAELLGRPGEIISVAVEWVYLGSLVTCFVLSFGNRPEGTKRFYLLMAWTWGGIMLFVFHARG
jgi:chitin synthase